MTASKRHTLSISETLRLVEGILVSAGDDGRLAAHSLVEAEMLGQPELGLQLLRELAEGRRLVIGEPIVCCASVASYDGEGCFGPVTVAAAARESALMAHATGVGIIGVRNVAGIGRLGPYASAIANGGLFGLVAVNSPAFVAPWGGRKAVFGTNPIAYAAPCTGRTPVMADLATSTITMFTLRRARATGSPLPRDAAIDETGNPTTEALLARALLPFGGVKGSVISFGIELLAGAMMGNRGSQTGRGVMTIAIDPAALGTERADEHVAQLVREMHEAGVRTPGERTAKRLAEAEARGELELDHEVYEMLVRLASGLNVNLQ